MSPKNIFAGALLALSFAAHAQDSFPIDGALKALNERLIKNGADRQSHLIGYQMETPIKANIVIFVEGSGVVFQSAYKLNRTKGEPKWYLVFPTDRKEPPVAID